MLAKLFPAGLILLAVISRLLPHPPNFTPVMATGIFAAAYLPKRWSPILPLTALFISDLFIGFYGWEMLFVYGSFALISFLSKFFVNKGILNLAAITFLGSILFFLITNFGTWLVWDFYPKSFNGLVTCYLAGIPFFRNTFLGDFVYTFSFFGVYGLVTGERRWLVLLPIKLRHIRNNFSF